MEGGAFELCIGASRGRSCGSGLGDLSWRVPLQGCQSLVLVLNGTKMDNPFFGIKVFEDLVNLVLGSLGNMKTAKVIMEVVAHVVVRVAMEVV